MYIITVIMLWFVDYEVSVEEQEVETRPEQVYVIIPLVLMRTSHAEILHS